MEVVADARQWYSLVHVYVHAVLASSSEGESIGVLTSVVRWFAARRHGSTDSETTPLLEACRGGPPARTSGTHERCYKARYCPRLAAERLHYIPVVRSVNRPGGRRGKYHQQGGPCTYYNGLC